MQQMFPAGLEAQFDGGCRVSGTLADGAITAANSSADAASSTSTPPQQQQPPLYQYSDHCTTSLVALMDEQGPPIMLPDAAASGGPSNSDSPPPDTQQGTAGVNSSAMSSGSMTNSHSGASPHPGSDYYYSALLSSSPYEGSELFVGLQCACMHHQHGVHDDGCVHASTLPPTPPPIIQPLPKPTLEASCSDDTLAGEESMEIGPPAAAKLCDGSPLIAQSLVSSAAKRSSALTRRRAATLHVNGATAYAPYSLLNSPVSPPAVLHHNHNWQGGSMMMAQLPPPSPPLYPAGGGGDDDSCSTASSSPSSSPSMSHIFHPQFRGVLAPIPEAAEHQMPAYTGQQQHYAAHNMLLHEHQQLQRHTGHYQQFYQSTPMHQNAALISRPAGTETKVHCEYERQQQQLYRQRHGDEYLAQQLRQSNGYGHRQLDSPKMSASSPPPRRRRSELPPFNPAMAPTAADSAPPVIFDCPFPGCDKTFSRFYNLKSHQRTHTGERPFVCEVEGCDAKFGRNHDLKRHRRVHTGDRPFRCADCGKSFSRLDALSRHLKVDKDNRERLYLAGIDLETVQGCHATRNV